VRNALLVALGGALGALARYGLATLALKRFGPGFPYGTLFINVTGCAIIGFFLAAVNGRWAGINAGWEYLVPIGFVGAYTTFSTFAYETVRLGQDHAAGLAVLNVVASVVVGVLAAWAGIGVGSAL